jgi:hypothetical protein
MHVFLSQHLAQLGKELDIKLSPSTGRSSPFACAAILSDSKNGNEDFCAEATPARAPGRSKVQPDSNMTTRLPPVAVAPEDESDAHKNARIENAARTDGRKGSVPNKPATSLKLSVQQTRTVHSHLEGGPRHSTGDPASLSSAALLDDVAGGKENSQDPEFMAPFQVQMIRQLPFSIDYCHCVF